MAALQGKVTAFNVALSGAKVRLYNRTSMAFIAETTSAGDGTFSFTTSAGAYLVTADKVGNKPWAWDNAITV